MAIVQSSALQVVNGAQSGAVTLSNVTAGNAILVTASIFSPTANDAPLVKDGSTTLTQVSAYTPGGNYSSAVVAWELNVAAGSHIITVQMTSAVTSGYYVFAAHEVSGLGSTQPSVSTTGTTTGTTLALSGATPAQSGCIIFTAIADDGEGSSTTATATTPSGYTSLWQEMNGSNYQIGAAAYQVQSTPAPVSPSWTALNAGGGAGWAAVAVAFAPSGSSGLSSSTTEAASAADSSTVINSGPVLQNESASAVDTITQSNTSLSSTTESSSLTDSGAAVNSGSGSQSILAYASVAAPNSTSTTSPLITTGITTPASGSTIIVNLLTQSTSTAPVSNFSDSYGNTWTLVATNYYAGGTAANGEFPSYLLKCVNAKGGSNHTFQLVKNSVQDECTIYAVVLNGGNIGNWTVDTTGTYSGTVTTSGANSAVLSFWSPNDTGVAGYTDNYHAPSGWVQMANNNNADNSMSGADAYLAPVANAGTVVTATWTADNTGGGINPGQCMYMVEVLASTNPNVNAFSVESGTGADSNAVAVIKAVTQPESATAVDTITQSNANSISTTEASTAVDASADLLSATATVSESASASDFPSLGSWKILQVLQNTEKWHDTGWATATTNVTVANGDSLIVMIQCWNSNSVGATYQPVMTPTPLTTIYDPESTYIGTSEPVYCQVFAAFNLAAGTYSITPPNVEPGSGDGDMYVLHVSGISGVRANTLGTDHQGSGTTGNLTSTTSTLGSGAQAGDLVVGIGGTDNNTEVTTLTVSTPSGWTNLAKQTDGTNSPPSSFDYTTATGGSQSATWTWPAESSPVADSAVVAFVPIGGVQESVTQSESATAVDTIAKSTSVTSAQLESVTAVDSESYTFLQSLYQVESGLSSDSLIPQVFYNLTINEIGSLVDSVFQSSSFVSSLTEIGSLADSVAQSNLFVSSLSEIGSLVDAIQVSGLYPSFQTESVTAIDLTVNGASIPLTQTETTNATDSQSPSSILYAAQVDASGALDFSVQSATIPVSITELSSALDSVLGYSNIGVLSNETSTATESSRTGSSSVLFVNEGGSLLDSSNTLISNAVQSLEHSTLQDVQSSLATLYAAISEGMAAQDSPISFVDYFVSTNESALSSDAQSNNGSIYVSLSESLNASDNQLPAALIRLSQTETGNSLDVIFNVTGYSANLVEAGTLGDSQSSGTLIGNIQNEFGSLSDSQAAVLVFHLEQNENSSGQDISVSYALISGNSVEFSNALDSSNSSASIPLFQTEFAQALDYYVGTLFGNLNNFPSSYVANAKNNYSNVVNANNNYIYAVFYTSNSQ